MKPTLPLFFFLVFSAALWAQSPTPPQSAGQIFAYNAKAPLDFQEKSVEQVHGVKVLDVSYVSPKGGRVPAFLIVPPGSGPFAGLVFVHWGQGDRSEFLAEAVMLAHAGA